MKYSFSEAHWIGISLRRLPGHGMQPNPLNSDEGLGEVDVTPQEGNPQNLIISRYMDE